MQDMDKAAAQIAQQVLDEHLRPMRRLLDDPNVQEVMINRYDNIWLERDGNTLYLDDIKLTETSLEAAITLLANLNHKPDALMMDCWLPGLRIATARRPVAISGPMLCIRKHSVHRLGLQHYVQNGAFDAWPHAAHNSLHPAPPTTLLHPALRRAMQSGGQALQQFFEWVMHTRQNLLVCGATSSGKTTLLNALIEVIPTDDRLITIEDTRELQVCVPNYVAFETHPAQGANLRELVRLALRCRPTRIIIGEIRGAEAFDLLNALNTGHPGSVVSFHADSCPLALTRLETLVRMAPEAQTWPLADLRQHIAATFRYVVHTQRVGVLRSPWEIREILGIQDNRYQTRLLFSKIQQETTAYDTVQ